MPIQKYWSDETVLEEKAGESRVPHHRPGPLLDEALDRWLRERPLDLSPGRASGGNFSAAVTRARAFTADRMGLDPDLHSYPLDPEVIEEEESGDYLRQEVVFTGTPPLRVPATVLVPRHRSGPFPAVAALHDMGAFRVFGKEKLLAFEGEPAALTEHRRVCYGGRSIMVELVRRGYLVVAVDALNFGPRTLVGATAPESFLQERRHWSPETLAAKTREISGEDEAMLVRNVESVGLTWPGIYTMDDMRTIDYLCQRSDVDPGRIGCLGLSVGGFRTNYLAAMDTRVQAAVSVCWSCTMDGLVGYNIRGAVGWFMLVQGLFSRLDIPDLQVMAVPRAFMAISGWQDQLFQPYGIAQAHRHLRSCYRKAGHPDQLGSLVYDSPHEFNLEMQQQAYAFIDEKLQP